MQDLFRIFIKHANKGNLGMNHNTSQARGIQDKGKYKTKESNIPKTKESNIPGKWRTLEGKNAI